MSEKVAEKVVKSEADWRKQLTDEQYHVMIRYGLYCFALFAGSAIVLSWVMFLIAR